MKCRKFISASYDYCDIDKWVAAPYIRKSFQLEFVPETAELVIAVLGIILRGRSCKGTV